jgi:HlyD family secretion protein
VAVLDACARVSGAAMDRPAPPRRPPFAAVALALLAFLGAVAALSQLIPHGLRVIGGSIRMASVERGMFHDDAVVRATAEPLHTIMLDAAESGRVEEILVTDGALVDKGALLFRLSNPQLRLTLAAREADLAQQISNLSALKVSIETNRTEHLRRRLDLEFSRVQAEKLYARNAALAKSGVIAAVALEESRDRLARDRRALDDEDVRDAVEMRIKRQGVEQMAHAVERLDAGLALANESLAALDVRAPIAGRLTDFRLQLGEIVKADQHLGRIDDPSRFKFVAPLDEYYLGGVAVGTRGSVTVEGRSHPVEVSRVFPQIKDGRFVIESSFSGESPTGLKPGQSVEMRLTLGEARPSMLLPNDAYLNDGGGTWVFAVAGDGRTAERRAIRIGRRNHSQVEVLSGLEPGERVIVSAYAGFGREERLQITN